MFSKPLNDLTCEDIKEFCERGIPESKHLDYKDEIPKEVEKIAKTIAAFANTQGGILIFGIKDESDRPKPPFEGISFREGLRNRIEQISRGHIEPVPFIETHVCPPEQGRTFVIVRIPQSTLTPHIVTGHKAIYVRTGESSTPEDVIDPSKIPWLFEGRAKSINHRNRLINEAECRFFNMFPRERKTVCTSGLVIPLYPEDKLFKFDDSHTVMERVQCTQSFSRLPMRSIPGGMVYGRQFDSLPRNFQFAQIQEVGMFYVRQSVRPISEGEASTFQAYSFFSAFCDLVQVVYKMQSALDIWTPMLVRFEVHNLYEKIIQSMTYAEDYYDSVGLLDNEFCLDITIPGGAIAELYCELLAGGLLRVMWMIGMSQLNKEVMAARLVKDGIIPHERRVDKLEEALVKAFKSDSPLIEFAFSTSISE